MEKKWEEKVGRKWRKKWEEMEEEVGRNGGGSREEMEEVKWSLGLRKQKKQNTERKGRGETWSERRCGKRTRRKS